MKLLAFAASNSSESINRQLVGYAVRLIAGGHIEGLSSGAVETSTLDLNDFEMPIYSIDRQNADGIPQQAHDFYRLIGSADALLISFAEHNGSYTAAYKNVFDWASRIDMRVYQGRPIVMLSTSPGSGGGGFVLRAAGELARYFGSQVLASLAIPKFGENFDTSSGFVRNSDLDAQLRTALASLSEVATDDRREATART
ncbi:NADPH-dependent FMN reductase [Candidatus Poriferisodalis sp.]|uniref:NADPH-dependent FMN reductase n=1 Tax=Candidatus Poriferisodalis sp. TaxID=3101277 RepID=UPI003B0175AD